MQDRLMRLWHPRRPKNLFW